MSDQNEQIIARKRSRELWLASDGAWVESRRITSKTEAISAFVDADATVRCLMQSGSDSWIDLLVPIAASNHATAARVAHGYSCQCGEYDFFPCAKWENSETFARAMASSRLQKKSPIEEAFSMFWAMRFPRMPLIRQHRVDRYFIDFAHIESVTAIELDGFASHSSAADIENDRRRQREIERNDWHVVRFGGSEVFRNAELCVLEAGEVILRRSKRLRSMTT